MDAAGIIEVAKIAGGALAVGIGIVTTLINVSPNKITATAAAKEKEAEEDRRMREEIRAERDRAVQRCDEMEAERDHWREQATSLRELLVTQQAVCTATGHACGQQFAAVKLQPFHPASLPALPPPADEKKDKTQ